MEEYRIVVLGPGKLASRAKEDPTNGRTSRRGRVRQSLTKDAILTYKFLYIARVLSPVCRRL